MIITLKYNTQEERRLSVKRAKVLSHNNAVRIAILLSIEGEKSVKQIANTLKMNVGTASYCLKVLKRAKLVESRRAGLYRFYKFIG